MIPLALMIRLDGLRSRKTWPLTSSISDGAGHWVFRYLPKPAPGEPRRVAWHRRSFSAVVEERSEKRVISVQEALEGRRDQFIKPYFKGAKPDEVVAVPKARERARIMIAIVDKASNRGNLQFASFSRSIPPLRGELASNPEPDPLSDSRLFGFASRARVARGPASYNS